MSAQLDKALDALLTDPSTGEPLSEAELRTMGRGCAIAIAMVVVIIAGLLGIGG